MSKVSAFKLEPGLVVKEEFFDYEAMQRSAKNWSYHLKIRLAEGDFYGYHDGVQLYDLQLGHSYRNNSVLYDGDTPKDCITLAVLQDAYGTVCINDMKMIVGDIVVIDDAAPYSFISNDMTKFGLVSISKALVAQEIPWFEACINGQFKDRKKIFSQCVDSLFEKACHCADLTEQREEMQMMQIKMIKAIKMSLYDQKAVNSTLTKGEQIAIEIRSCAMRQLEENLSISSMVERFNVSDKTIETSFKTLYGMTPKRFFTLIKLNYAHDELLSSTPSQCSVSEIAMKWGFDNFGRFSRRYKQLFGSLPSDSLNRSPTKTSKSG